MRQHPKLPSCVLCNGFYPKPFRFGYNFLLMVFFRFFSVWLLWGLWLLPSSEIAGQAYFTAAGLRLGTEWGLTVQHRFTKRWTGEAILQSGLFRKEVLFTALAERHFPIVTKNLNVYGGGGVHWAWLKEDGDLARTGVGLSFIGGLELSLGRLNISYDIKPAFTLSLHRPILIHTGISVRYILVKGNVFKKQQRKKRRKKRQEQFKWPWAL